MAYLNYFLQFKAFADKNPSNSPNLTNMNWVRDVQGVPVENQATQVLTLAASGAATLFDSEDVSKRFLYIESDSDLQIAINNGAAFTISPLVVGTSRVPASYLLVGPAAKIVITNPNSTDEVSVFIATAE